MPGKPRVSRPTAIMKKGMAFMRSAEKYLWGLFSRKKAIAAREFV